LQDGVVDGNVAVAHARERRAAVFARADEIWEKKSTFALRTGESGPNFAA
jgi:hypothetical protein